LGEAWKDLTAEQILGRYCSVLKDGDEYKIGIRSLTGLISVRDMGQMTSGELTIVRPRKEQHSLQDFTGNERAIEKILKRWRL